MSGMEWYIRQAVAGSMVGFLTEASRLLMTGASLWSVLVLGSCEGLLGGMVAQKLLNDEGGWTGELRLRKPDFSRL